MKHAYKIVGIILVLYSFVAGLLVDVPDLPVVHQSIRNLFFHVPMWFAMIALLLISLISGLKHLRSGGTKNDLLSVEAVKVALLFGILGIITGSLWARYTWGAWWVSDPKLNGAALTILTYFAYLVLRRSIPDSDRRAKVSAVYNVLAFVFMLLFIIVLPRMSFGSLHPGSEGNPVLGGGQLDPLMRLVFYPAVVGWILIGFWLTRIRMSIEELKTKIHDD